MTSTNAHWLDNFERDVIRQVAAGQNTPQAIADQLVAEQNLLDQDDIERLVTMQLPSTLDSLMTGGYITRTSPGRYDLDNLGISAMRGDI